MVETDSIRYRRIRIDNSDDIARLYPLITDYLRNPTLANSVEELVLTNTIPDDDQGYLCYADEETAAVIRTIIEEQDTRVVSQNSPFLPAIKDLGVPDDKVDEWLRVLTWMDPEVKATREGNEYIARNGFPHRDPLFAQHAAAILVALCPHIERLTLRDSYYRSPLPDVLIKHNYGQTPGKFLQKLKHVSLLAIDEIIISDERFFTTMDFLGLFRLFHRLPAVQSIDVGGVSEDDAGSGWCMHPPHTANFDTIHIEHSDFSSTFLATLIGAPKALRNFSMSVGGRGTLDGGFSDIQPQELGRALYLQKNTLESLDLDVDECVYERHEETGYEIAANAEEEAHKLEYHNADAWFVIDAADSPGPFPLSQAPLTRTYGSTIGSLHDFTALTHLAIGIKTLLGTAGEPPFKLVDALPKSLQSLLLRGYEKGVNTVHDAHVEELMNNRETVLPNLREVLGVDVVIPSSTLVDDINEAEEIGGVFWEPETKDTDWLEVAKAEAPRESVQDDEPVLAQATETRKGKRKMEEAEIKDASEE